MNTITTYLLTALISAFLPSPAPELVLENPPPLNCTANVDAGPDQIICDPATVTLTGTVNPPDALSVSWSPTTGLANPNSLVTTANVSQTTTYTLTATVASNQNQIFNGDFNAGLMGFTSDYVEGTGGAFGLLSSEGTFAIAANASDTHNNFAPCTDHTGGGNMLVVNGAGVPNQNVWCQQVNVTPNTTYAFSAWITTVVSSSPALLQFSVNGQLLGGIFTAPSSTCTWTNFYQTWDAGNNNSVEICIVNQNTALSGNDFAIDDLFFGEVCTFTDEVTITLQPVDASWTPPTGLCPFSPIIDLNSLLNPGATPGGTWTINGFTTSFFDPLDLGPGAHQVTYTVGDPPCTEMNTQFIIVETLPLAEWDIPFSPCENSPAFDLDLFLSPASEPGGTWTINGQPATQLDPGLLGAGPHFIVYTAGTPPCTNEHTGFVDILPSPNVTWTAPPPLCADAAPVLLNNWLTNDAVTNGTWTIDGQPAIVFDPALLGPGDYTVNYVAGQPPCNESLSQTVSILPAPNAGWSAAGFYCETVPAFALNDLLDLGADPNGDWTLDGQPADTFDPSALSAGFHTLTYTVGDGDCQAGLTDSVEVGANPVADFSLSADTLCLSDSLTVTYTGTISPTLVLHWSVDSLPTPPDTARQLTLAWPDTGVYNISLWVEDGPCRSDTMTQTVWIEAPLEVPVPVCGPAANQSIGISWPPVAGAAGYSVQTIPGDTVTTNDTTFTLTGLTPGQTVGFLVTALSNNACPSIVSDTLFCMTQDCTPAPVSVEAVAPLCYADTLPTLSLTVQVDDTTGLGSGFWSGPGIVDSLTGLFDPVTAGPGIHALVFQYELFNCVSADTTVITIVSPPTASFLFPDTICAGDTVTLLFDGQANPGDLFQWNADGGQVLTQTDSILQIVWTTGGTFQPSLQLNGAVCDSDIFSSPVTVATPPVPPLIQCRTTSTSVEFYWSPDPAFDAYTVVSLDGLTGTMTADTSYQFAGLTPGQEVSIELTAQTNGPCPDVVSIQSCVASDCPDGSLTIGPVDPVCFSDTLSAFPLTATLSGANSGGSYTWSGPGINDTLTGVFAPLAAGPGSHLITVTYQESVCTYQGQQTITIHPEVVAAFTLDTLFCQRDTVAVTFTGQAPPGVTFDWDFGQALTVSGSGAGPFALHWPAAGSDEVNLTLSANGCTDTFGIPNITIDPLPVAPAVSCEADYTTITVHWPEDGTMDPVDITVLNGPDGAVIADTSYRVSGLQPGQTVDLQFDWLSENTCPDTTTLLSCQTLPCPDVQLSILPMDTICWNGSPDTLQLIAELSGNGPDGVLSWQGPGIVDTLAGLWAPDGSLAGQDVTITATYREAVCTFQAETEIPVRPQPVSDFSINSLLCLDAAAQAQWEGTPAPDLTFIWNFGPAQADPGEGPGPHTLSWPSAGLYEVSLQVTAESCVSETSFRTVQVDPPLSETTPECSVDYTTMTLSWPSVAGAQAYELTAPQPLPAGTWLADTAYQIEGLAPGTTFDFELTISGETVCGPIIQPFSCTTLDCPELSAALTAPAAICEGQEATLQFTADVAGAPYRLVLGAGGEEFIFENLSESEGITLTPAAGQSYDILGIESLALPACGVTGPAPFSIQVQTPPAAGLPLESAAYCNSLDTVLSLLDLVESPGAGGIWSDVSPVSAGGAFNASLGTFRPWQLPAGDYTFQYRVEGPAVCPADSLTVGVTVHPTPVADAGPDQTLDCLVSVLSIGGPGTSEGPGLIYEWTAVEGGMMSEPDLPYTDVSQPGLYTLTVADPATGCSSRDAMRVDSDVAFPDPVVRLQGVGCYGETNGAVWIDSVSGGVPPYTFALNDGPFGSQPAFTALGTGNYRLRVRDSRGCETEHFYTLNEPPLLAVQLSSQLDPDRLVLTLGDSLYLFAQVNIDDGAIDTLIWQPDSLGCPGCREQRLLPVVESTYTVNVIDTSGCTASDQLRIFIRREQRVFIPNAFSPDGDGINDVVMIFAGPEVREVRSFDLFNRWGESVFSAAGFPPNDPTFGWDGRYRGEPMNPGVFVYFALIEMADGSEELFKGEVVLLK